MKLKDLRKNTNDEKCLMGSDEFTVHIEEIIHLQRSSTNVVSRQKSY